MNLLELLHDQVLQQSHKECLRFKKDGKYQSMTYEEFWESIMRLAIGLQACGVESGTKVGILSPNCPEWAISDYALLSLGAVVVPIYPTLPVSQVNFILQNADVEFLLLQDAAHLEKIQQQPPKCLNRVILFNGNVECTDGSRFSFADVMKIGKKREVSYGRPDIHLISEDQIATIVHTSGTSGSPKGVMLSHLNIVSNIKSSLSYLPIETTDITLSYLPLSHIFERTVGQFAVLSTGATIAYAESISTLQDNLQEVSPSILVTVPRLLEKVYAKTQSKIERAPKILQRFIRSGIQKNTRTGLTYRLVDILVFQKLRKGLGGRIRYVVSGGAGLATHIAEFFIKAGIPIYEGYGMTESAPVICTNPFGESRPGTVGRPIPGVEICLAEDGELMVKGPNVMLGYYGAPLETQKAITPDGWLHTGDIVEIQDGYVKIVDRKKNLLVLATGKNVAPWPIENAIKSCRYLSEAVLIGDGRNYVTSILFPDFEALSRKAAEFQLGDNRDLWVKDLRIHHLIREEIIRNTQSFATFEQPKRAILLPDELSIEAGDLTPTLKIRNKAILQKYGHLIEAMYSGTDYLPIFEPLPLVNLKET